MELRNSIVTNICPKKITQLWCGKKKHLVGGLEHFLFFHIWGWVKTLVPSEPQNSWDLWMFIPLKKVLIGIDPYPYWECHHPNLLSYVLKGLVNHQPAIHGAYGQDHFSGILRIQTSRCHGWCVGYPALLPEFSWRYEAFVRCQLEYRLYTQKDIEIMFRLDHGKISNDFLESFTNDILEVDDLNHD